MRHLTPNDRRLAKYGLTWEEWKQMLERQGNACAICGDRQSELVIDHNHKSGKVRGLLCSNCNSGLGMFKDNRHALRTALLYLDGLYDGDANSHDEPATPTNSVAQA